VASSVADLSPEVRETLKSVRVAADTITFVVAAVALAVVLSMILAPSR
jgi:hypothetical protein